MIEDSLRLEETGESYIWFIQYESRDLPHGPETVHRHWVSPTRGPQVESIKKRKNVFENEFCEINWYQIPKITF